MTKSYCTRPLYGVMAYVKNKFERKRRRRPNRPPQFQKSSQLIIRVHNETLSVVAMCAPLRIHKNAARIRSTSLPPLPRLRRAGPVRTQLTWCEKEGVPRAIITHCGSEIVTGDERQIAVKIGGMAAERGVETRIAYDGMKVKV
jgi:hypothetical protein